MAVHHVDVDPVGAGGLDGAHFLAELGEIGGQDRGGDLRADAWSENLQAAASGNTGRGGGQRKPAAPAGRQIAPETGKICRVERADGCRRRRAACGQVQARRGFFAPCPRLARLLRGLARGEVRRAMTGVPRSVGVMFPLIGAAGGALSILSSLLQSSSAGNTKSAGSNPLSSLGQALSGNSGTQPQAVAGSGQGAASLSSGTLATLIALQGQDGANAAGRPVRALDADGDGKISKSEFESALGKAASIPRAPMRCSASSMPMATAASARANWRRRGAAIITTARRAGRAVEPAELDRLHRRQHQDRPPIPTAPAPPPSPMPTAAR